MIELEPRERGALQVGSCVVLSTLGFGFQFGHWPAWSALLALGGYVAWVVIYSEGTMQARRWWPARGRSTLPEA